MKLFYMAIAMLLISCAPSQASRCVGANPCEACRNCSACKLCSQNGGTCGVCSGARRKDKNAAVQQKPLKTKIAGK